MAFFRIIIPNYNSAKWIDKGLKSIFSQSFPNYVIHIVDDESTDNCMSIIQAWRNVYPERLCVHRLPKKSGYPGGTRNYCLHGALFTDNADYTLFMDSDDWFCDNQCLQRIYDAAVENNYPDVIRLPFVILESEKKRTYVPLKEGTVKDIAVSPFFAPWTKAIKTEMLVKFPEKTLFEDIPQHIAQLDILETAAYIDDPVIVWNRLKENDVSLTANLRTNAEYRKKLDISTWQLLADLYRMELRHDYSNNARNSWIAFAKQRVKDEGMI